MFTSSDRGNDFIDACVRKKIQVFPQGSLDLLEWNASCTPLRGFYVAESLPPNVVFWSAKDFQSVSVKYEIPIFY